MRASAEAGYRDYVTARSYALWHTAFLLCGDAHQAEDVVQTALLKLYVAWHRVERAENRDAYVRRVLVRCVIDEKRRGLFTRNRPFADRARAGHPARNPPRPAGDGLGPRGEGAVMTGFDDRDDHGAEENAAEARELFARTVTGAEDRPQLAFTAEDLVRGGRRRVRRRRVGAALAGTASVAAVSVAATAFGLGACGTRSSRTRPSPSCSGHSIPEDTI